MRVATPCALALLLLTSCSTPLSTREKGALIGGGGGAGLGALLGGGTGAVIGGAAGALGGGLIGDQFQRHEQTERGQQQQLNRLQQEQRRRALHDHHYKDYTD